MLKIDKAKQNKIAFFLIPVIIVLAVVEMYKYSQRAIEFSAEGIVVEAKWNTANHNTPLFRIREAKGIEKEFHATNILLRPEQIKKGDRFKKSVGSKNCEINDVKVKCVK